MVRGKAVIKMMVVPNRALAEWGWETGPKGYMIFIVRVDDEERVAPLLAFTDFEMIDEFAEWLRKSKAELEPTWQQRETSKLSLTIAEIDAFLLSQKL